MTRPVPARANAGIPEPGDSASAERQRPGLPRTLLFYRGARLRRYTHRSFARPQSMVRSALLVLLLGLPIVEGAAAQPSPSDAPGPWALEGRHSLAVGLGLFPGTPSGAAGGHGFLGALSYTCWLHAGWGIQASASLFDADAESAASVTSLLLGARYAPEALALGSFVRPSLSGAVGPYIRSESEGVHRRRAPRTRTALGGRADVGLGAHAWDRLRASYHVAPSRKDVLGTGETAGSAHLSFELGVVFEDG